MITTKCTLAPAALGAIVLLAGALPNPAGAQSLQTEHTLTRSISGA